MFSYVGFWTMPLFEEFRAALAIKAQPLDWSWGEHTVLTDLSDFAIQSKEVFGAFAEMIEHDPSQPRRAALVGGNGLAQMQFRRVLRAENMRLFHGIDEAERWLSQPVTAGLSSASHH